MSTKIPGNTSEITPTQKMSKGKVSKNDLIQLPNGFTVKRRDTIPGNLFFEFVTESTNGDVGSALKTLMIQCFVDQATGELLTIENMEDGDGIGFEGVATLAESINDLFPGAREKLKSLRQAK